MMSSNIAINLSNVKNQIEFSAKKVKRDIEEITLIAVSKTHPVNVLQECVAAGAIILGENKVQEAETKFSEISGVEWHLIGHLQSNKVRKAVKIFDVIQTVDSIELAERLERICQEENRSGLKVFIQVDLGEEDSKSGVSENDLPQLLEFISNCKCLKLQGLMQIPPYFDDVEKVRPFFRKLREIRDRLLPNGSLSMGMSHDFPIAIEEGATHIRVGTAIFGQRNYQR